MSVWSSLILESGPLGLDTFFKILLPNPVSNWLVQALHLRLELLNVAPKLYVHVNYVFGHVCRILKGAQGERTVNINTNWLLGEEMLDRYTYLYSKLNMLRCVTRASQ